MLFLRLILIICYKYHITPYKYLIIGLYFSATVCIPSISMTMANHLILPVPKGSWPVQTMNKWSKNPITNSFVV